MKGGLGVDGLKGLYKGDEGTLLRFIKCVGRTAPTVETANVADADAVLIVSIGMGSHLVDGAAGMEGAVEVDDKMIANVLKTPLEMPAAYLVDSVVAVFAGGCAVDNNIVDFSHGGGILFLFLMEAFAIGEHPPGEVPKVFFLHHFDVTGSEVLTTGVELDTPTGAHTALDHGSLTAEIAGGVGRIALERCGQAGGKEGCLALGELGGGVMKIVLAGSFAAIDAIAELDNVEIAFHDAFLAPNQLDEGGVVGLDGFAEHAVFVGEETVFGGLLADGASATLATSFLALNVSHLHLTDVEPMVVHEKAVLGNDNGVDQIVGNLADRHIVAFEANGAFGVAHLLEETFDHEGSEGRIEKGTEKHLNNGEAPDSEQRDPEDTPEFASETELTPTAKAFGGAGLLLFFLFSHEVIPV